MIVDDSFSRLTARMIVRGKIRSRTIIDYHAPFDRGFTPRCYAVDEGRK